MFGLPNCLSAWGNIKFFYDVTSFKEGSGSLAMDLVPLDSEGL